MDKRNEENKEMKEELILDTIMLFLKHRKLQNLITKKEKENSKLILENNILNELRKKLTY